MIRLRRRGHIGGPFEQAAMRYFLLGVLIFSLAGAAPSAMPSASPSPSPSAATTAASPLELERSRIETMLRTAHADPAWFSDSFLAQVPAGKIDAVLAQIRDALGDFQNIETMPESTSQKFVVHFAKGTDDVYIHLDADDKIDGLLFRPPVLKSASLEDALHGLQSSGTLSYTVIVEGRERAALSPSTSM